MVGGEDRLEAIAAGCFVAGISRKASKASLRHPPVALPDPVGSGRQAVWIGARVSANKGSGQPMLPPERRVRRLEEVPQPQSMPAAYTSPVQ
ncbi:hypothetical protein Sbs19_03970 [Sphingobium sp. BS19]|nr:hypothetical protein Sbs19_03970 [Sphingobium sp. BS19]